MEIRSAKRLFVWGSLICLVVFLILTVDTLRKVPLRSNALRFIKPEDQCG